MSLEILDYSYIVNKAKKFQIDLTIDDNFLPIKLTNVDPSIANAFRRIASSEIENYALPKKKCQIIKNTSQYHNEVLMERMGLIIIDQNKYKDKYGPHGGPVEFRICQENDHEQPLINQGDEIMKVTLHQHLKVYTLSKQLEPCTEICPYDSLLMTLNPREMIHIQAAPELGCGLQHIIWQSSIAMYKFVTPLDQRTSETVETNQQQMEYNGYQTKQPNSIILTIESIGKFNAKVILIETIKKLIKKLNDFLDGLQTTSKPDEEDFLEKKIVLIEDQQETKISIKISAESHTLGNVLQHACFTQIQRLIDIFIGNHLTDGEDETRIRSKLIRKSFASYQKPHPLYDYIILTVTIANKLTEQYENNNYMVEFIREAVREQIEQCQHLLKQAENSLS